MKISEAKELVFEKKKDLQDLQVGIGRKDRSNDEIREIVKLLYENKGKEEILKHMENPIFEKWNTHGKKYPQYQKDTYTAASKYVLEHPSEKVEKTFKQKQYEGQLKENIETLPERDSYTAKQMMSEPLKQREYWLDKCVPKGRKMLIGGKPGEFKTGLLLNMILSMTQGSSFLELFPAHGKPKILYYDADDNGKDSFQWKFKYFMNGNKYNEEVLDRIKFESDFFRKRLDIELKNIEPYDIIVLDSYRRVLDGNENDSDVTNRFFLDFLKIAARSKIQKTIIVLHHTKKGNLFDNLDATLLDMFRGNSDIVSQFQEVIAVGKFKEKSDIKTGDNEFDVYLEAPKNRDDLIIPKLGFHVDKKVVGLKTTLSYTGTNRPKEMFDAIESAIIAFVEKNPGAGPKEFLKHLRKNNLRTSRQTLNTKLGDLVELDEIEKIAHGQYQRFGFIDPFS